VNELFLIVYKQFQGLKRFFFIMNVVQIFLEHHI